MGDDMCAFVHTQDEGEEEETDELVSQVLDEIGIGNMIDVSTYILHIPVIQYIRCHVLVYAGVSVCTPLHCACVGVWG